jgi:oxygen-independent coproporphyrinogen-3 oxidase
VRKQISTVMCQFRCEFSSEEEWHKWYRNHQYTIDEFEKDGLIEKQNNGFLVTKKGRAFVRNIAMVFDPYLTQRPAQFSATV